MDWAMYVIVALMLGLLGLVSCVWWLVRLWKHRDKWRTSTRAVIGTLAALVAFFAIATLVGLVRAFGVIGGESVDPSQNARILAEGISEAINFCTIWIVLWVAASALLLILSRSSASKIDQ